MPRRIEDIKIGDKRSIRDIPLSKSLRSESMPSRQSERRQNSDRISRSDTESEKITIHKMKVTPPIEKKEDPKVTERRVKNKGKRIFAVIALAVVLIVAGTALIATTYFSRATFTIVPTTLPAKIEGVTVVATGTSTPDYLRYEIVKYSGTASTSIPSSDGSYISSKAAGNVTLYNSFSSQSQRLIAGTRLSGDNGLIYRLPSSIIVPGYTTLNGSIIPGTLKTKLLADQPGAEYNLMRSQGTGEVRIVAFQGNAKYDSIYGKLTSDIVGGFAGTKKTVSPRLLASTTKELEAALTKVLLNRARASVPEGYITYDKAYSISSAQPIVGGNTPKVATVTLTSNLYSIVFKKSDLTAKLVGQTKLSMFGNGKYATDGLDKLSFAITNSGTWNPAKQNTLIAKFSGNLSLSGIVPVEELRTKLQGKSLAQTRAVFSEYSGVIDVPKSSGELFPSWGQSVPKDGKRIVINLKK